MSEAVEAKKTAAKEENEFLLKLSREYDFEGHKVSEIDFSGLDDLTANEMIKANKVLNTSGSVTVLPETDLQYTLVIASEATEYPIEFYKMLKPRDAIKVKNKVTSFFFGEE